MKANYQRNQSTERFVDSLAPMAARGETKPRRRTQAERREASRTALLEAAVDCLLEDGYANLTTRRVAERAGVSQGTQMHYFPTKTEFVAEAIRYVAQRLAAEAIEQLDPQTFTDPDRREALLDELWRLHKSPVVQATMELWVAARTDPQLKAGLRKLDRDIAELMSGAVAELLPDQAAEPGFFELINTGLAAIRGLAMLQPVVQPKVLEQRWEATKRLLLETFGSRLQA
jgi:AcrR family transcriptional regulator